MAETLASRRTGEDPPSTAGFGSRGTVVFAGGSGAQKKMTSCWVLKEQPAAGSAGHGGFFVGCFFGGGLMPNSHTSFVCWPWWPVAGCWWVWCGVGVLVV
jgi:hypothetical protein